MDQEVTRAGHREWKDFKESKVWSDLQEILEEYKESAIAEMSNSDELREIFRSQSVVAVCNILLDLPGTLSDPEKSRLFWAAEEIIIGLEGQEGE